MWIGEAGEQNNKVLVSSRGTGTGDVWKATCGGCFTKGDQDVPEMQELTMEQGVWSGGSCSPWRAGTGSGPELQPMERSLHKSR